MNYRSLYVSFLKSRFNFGRPLTVVFDSSNGTTGPILKELFRSGTRRSHFLNAAVDGSFPAHGPNPFLPGAVRQLRNAVRSQRADVGVIFDADGDRALFVDDHGNLMDPDVILFLLAKARRGRFLIDVRTGWLIRRHIPRRRWNVVPVGHTNIKRAMRVSRVPFAGERSGHYYFNPKRNLYMDSGILCAAEFLSLVSTFSSPLSSVSAALPRYYRSGELNFRVRNAQNVLTAVEKACRGRRVSVSHVDGLSVESGTFWFNLRPSGTEPLLRLNAEAISRRVLSGEVARMKAIIRR